MTEKLFFRFALLFFLGSIVISVSGDSESKSVESSSKEKSDESKSGSDEKKDKTTTTVAPKNKADTKSLDKLILNTFKLTTDLKADDLEDFLKAMEFKKADRDKIRNAPSVEVRITKIKKENYEIHVHAGAIQVHKTTFKVGKEFNGKLFDGRTYKGTIKFQGKNKVIVDEKHAGFNCHHELKFSKKGFTSKLDCKGVKAEQEYKKMDKPEEPKNPFKNDNGGFKFEFGR